MLLTKKTDRPAAEPPAAAAVPVVVPDELPARLGPSVHTAGRWRSKGFLTTTVRPAAAPSTTNQARVLNSAIIGNPGSERGIALGDDQLSGSAVFNDVFASYEARLISSPNVCVLGALGAAKSAMVKTQYVLRPLMLRDRRGVVLDKKPFGDTGDGEYSALTRWFGAEPFTMLPGDPAGTALNILDPLVLAAGSNRDESRAAALGLVVAFAELAGNATLSTLEHATLAAAHRRLLKDFETSRRVPVIEDLLALLPGIVDSDDFAGRRPATLDAIDAASLDVQVRMQRLLADDLAGMFDRETSKDVVLHPKLTTFNISNLPEDGPATALVIAVVNALLMGMLRRNRDHKKTTLVIEEAWNLLLGQAAKNIRSNLKLARALGLSTVSVIHHISDIPAGSDGMAMIKEASTIHLFRQSQEDDIADCVRTFGLEPSNADVLRTLPQGQHLLKVGTAKEVHVRAHRTDSEIGLTETDEAMLARPTTPPAVALPGPRRGLELAR